MKRKKFQILTLVAEGQELRAALHASKTLHLVVHTVTQQCCMGAVFVVPVAGLEGFESGRVRSVHCVHCRTKGVRFERLEEYQCKLCPFTHSAQIVETKVV